MKKRAFLGLAALLLWAVAVCAQDVPAGVVQAFKKGSSQELKGYLCDQVELVFQGKPQKTDKQNAEVLMGIFFSSNKVSGFTVNHQGKRDDSSFIVGTLSTSNGDFRVNCFFKRIQNNYFVHQIRIDKTNE